MPLIAWLPCDDESPTILAIFDALTASTGTLQHDTYLEFERKVGRTAAEAALGEYYRRIEEGD